MIKTKSRLNLLKPKKTKGIYKLNYLKIKGMAELLQAPKIMETISTGFNGFFDILEEIIRNNEKFKNLEFKDLFNNKNLIKAMKLELLKTNKKLPKVLNISQSHEINTLKHTLTGANKKRFNENILIEINNYDDSLTATREGKKSFKTELKIEEFGIIKQYLNEKLCKLLDVIFYNQDQHYNKGYLEIPIEHYIQYTGRRLTQNNLKDIPKKELRDLLKVLNNFNITSIKQKSSYSFVRPFSRAEYSKGHIIIGFDNLFVESINKDYFTLPKEVGQLKGPAYHIANYIYLYSRQRKDIEFSLTNETIHKYSDLPRYTEVKRGSYRGDIGKSIIDPLSKALFQIKEKLKNDIEIEEESFEGGNWTSFKKAKIHIKVKNQEVINNVRCLQKAKKKQIEKNKKRIENRKKKQA